ncbi:MAG: methyltransferase [Pelolinea sp.]|nr:methyltransferase [Pelolinea sp.]
MQFIPNLELGWLNGWMPLAFFYTLFGLFLLSCPKRIVKKLYSVHGWTKREYILSAVGKPFAIGCLIVVILSPLKIGSTTFWIGMVLYALGCITMFIALFEYRATPADKPVCTGIYQYSRNPQWVGLALMFLGTAVACGNGLAVLLFICGLVLYHFRIQGEEKACLAAYGKPYQEYLNAVRRYF